MITILRFIWIWVYEISPILYSRVSVLDERLKTIASSLEHHLDVWKKKDDFLQSYKAVVDYIQIILKMDLTEDEILRVITSSYTNDFSHTLQNGNQVWKELIFFGLNLFCQIQLMFPLTAMMNHSCQPSISRTITTVSNNKQDMMQFKMRVVAAKPLSQGEQIYNSYIDILDPIQVRQKHLALTKQMVCGCTRCSDPTDLGSYGSAVLCQKCQVRGIFGLFMFATWLAIIIELDLIIIPINTRKWRDFQEVSTQ